MKLSIIGAGNVGTTAAFLIAQRSFVDELVLTDIVDSVVGKALDIKHSLPIFESTTKVSGTTNLEATKGSDIVVITAGMPRQPGKTREDMLKVNVTVLKDILLQVKTRSPQAILIMVTNPLDVLTYFAVKETNFPRERVLGMAGTLDSARFKSFIAQQTKGVIEGMVLGSHNDLMAPILSQATVDGDALANKLDKAQLTSIVEETKKAGATVGQLLGTSGYIAPGAAITQLVAAIANNSGETLPASTLLEGEYGLQDVCIGVPCKISRTGVKVIEMECEEIEQLRQGAAEVKNLIKALP